MVPPLLTSSLKLSIKSRGSTVSAWTSMRTADSISCIATSVKFCLHSAGKCCLYPLPCPIFQKSSPFATSYFRMTRSNQILFSGGDSFIIEHHPARSLPAAITYHGEGFHVKLRDAPRFRSYCCRYGHTVEKCCTKKHLLLNKPMVDAYLEYPIQPAATEDAEMTNRANSRQPTPEGNQPTDTTYQPPTIPTH